MSTCSRTLAVRPLTSTHSAWLSGSSDCARNPLTFSIACSVIASVGSAVSSAVISYPVWLVVRRWRRPAATYDTPMPRVPLLLPTATYRASDFLAASRALDAEVVVASERRQAMSGTMGDRALVVDLRRPAAAEAIVARAQDKPLDAVVGADEQGVLVAALAAARLGLAHNPPEAVAATRDKTAMRGASAAAGLRQPDTGSPGPTRTWRSCRRGRSSLRGQGGFAVGEPRRDPRRRSAGGRRRGRAGQGDPRRGRRGPGRAAAGRALRPGRGGGRRGPPARRRPRVLAVFDKPDPLEGPYFEETIYVTPSRLPAETLEAVSRVTAEAAAALGLLEGPIHAELRIDGDGVWMLELAARSIGGLCSRSLRFGMGVSLEELILRHALGLPLDDLSREAAASGVMMLPIPRRAC